MDQFDKEFATLVARAIDEVASAVDEARANGEVEGVRVTTAIQNKLRTIHDKILTNSLAKAQGATLGITRNIDDGTWASDELLDLAVEIDKYYMNKYSRATPG